MKNTLLKVLCLAGILGTSLQSLASTSITTSTVSGHWTLAGSPYLVYNDITVSPGTTLAIDPGVEVIFQGSFRLNVQGMLTARGTASQQISFHVNDTTGWYNRANAQGGWHGIQFQGISGPDSSILQYCNIYQTKFDSLDGYVYPAPPLGTLYSYRGLQILNCSIHDNRSFNLNMIDLQTGGAGQQVEIGNCSIYNNVSGADNIFLFNYYGGSSYLHNNTIHDNIGQCTLLASDVILLMENNEIYNDSGFAPSNGCVTFYGTMNVATVRGNSIHNNVSPNDGAIFCTEGFIDINANLICNNHHVSGTCGAVDGGGGINICFNSGGTPAGTFYTVRNNIIANNYSPFHGGGISIFNAPAVVSNNLVINNSTNSGGCVYVLDTFPTTFKNNIFYNNVNASNDPVTSPSVEGSSSKSITYDHNWTQHYSAYDMQLLGLGIPVLGDTTTNIRGTNPDIISPTLTYTLSESALSHDFHLMTSSACINAGDTVGADADSVDYARFQRIYGSAIDMGPYEYSPAEYGTLHVPVPAVQQNFKVYPNPAANVVFIVTSEPAGTIQLTDMSGRTVAEQKVNSSMTSIELRSLPKGLYLAAWYDGNGHRNVQKITVE